MAPEFNVSNPFNWTVLIFIILFSIFVKKFKRGAFNNSG